MDPIISANNSPHRYKQLDSLRGLGALSVYFTHFLGFKMATPLFSVLRVTPFGILFNGNAALMFFFVLSGFVLSIPFIDGDKPLKLTAFYIKRVFRIYPAFIFAIILSVILKEFVFDKNGFAYYNDWIKNFWTWGWGKLALKDTLKTLTLIGPDVNVNLIDPPIWSLVIEMKMSIIIPFFIIIASRSNVAFNSLFLVAITLLTYRYNGWALGIFYLGVLMAKYKDYLLHKISLWRAGTLIAVSIICILLYNLDYEVYRLYPAISSPFKYIYTNYLMATGGCVLMMIVLALPKAARFFLHPVLTSFGDLSYSFYLIHIPILLTVASLFSNYFTMSPVYVLISAFIIATVLSYLMVNFIERPFQQYAVKLVKRYKIFNTLGI